MTDRRSRFNLASAAALMVASASLAACEQRAYPEPSMAAETGPPPAAPELMGAPEGRDGRPLPPPEGYGPPPAYGAPQGDQPGAMPPPYPPGPSDNGYPPPAPEPGPPRVIAMEPIPNPPDVERGPGHRRAHRRYGEPITERAYEVPARTRPSEPYAYAYARPSGPPPRPDRVIEGTPVPNPPEYRPHREGHVRTHVRAVVTPSAAHQSSVAARHHHRHHLHIAPAPAHPIPHRAAHPATRPAPAPVHSAAVHHPAKAVPAHKPAVLPPMPKGRLTTQPRHITPAKPPAPVVKSATSVKPLAAGPVVAKPVPPILKTPLTPIAPAKTAPEHKGKHPQTATTKPPTADETAKLTALSGALTRVVAARAALHGADALRTGTPGDVTLSVPQDFADGLKSEATKAGLADAAASAALTAKLSGEGYAVDPSDSVTQPLMSGQPNTFKWTVTRMDAARGPLRAEVGADLLGGGKQHVDLGGVSAAPSATRGRISPQAIGVGILALVVLLVGFIMAGGRRSEGRFGRS